MAGQPLFDLVGDLALHEKSRKGALPSEHLKLTWPPPRVLSHTSPFSLQSSSHDFPAEGSPSTFVSVESMQQQDDRAPRPRA